MEPPDGCVDYSDDEEERRAKAAARTKKSSAGADGQAAGPSNANHRKKRQRSDAGRQMTAAATTSRGNFQHSANPFYMRGPSPAANQYAYANHMNYASPSGPNWNQTSHPPPHGWPPNAQLRPFPRPSWSGAPPAWTGGPVQPPHMYNAHFGPRPPHYPPPQP